MITVLFFFVALIYASAGFGGGSLYLAILSQTSPLSIPLLKFHGLLNNLGVTLQGTYQWKNQIKHRKKEIIQLISFAALPCMAFGLLTFKLAVHQTLLGIFLSLGGIAILGQQFWEKHYLPMSNIKLSITSFFIGSIAGLTGIGGGIYFSPILHLSRWGNPKEIAAFTSLFIAVNSALSLLILVLHFGVKMENIHWDWLLAVIVGGILGSKLSIQWLKQNHVKWITGILLIFAGQQLIWKG